MRLRQVRPLLKKDLEPFVDKRTGISAAPPGVRAILDHYQQHPPQPDAPLVNPVWFAPVIFTYLTVLAAAAVLALAGVFVAEPGVVAAYSPTVLCQGHTEGRYTVEPTINGVYCEDGSFHYWTGGDDHGSCRLGALC